MALPDEIFINPRLPKDVKFGQSIVAPLTGGCGSYIKTDRVGEMTDYIDNTELHPLPIRDYKCYASRFLRSWPDLNITPALSTYNTDDTFAVNINNLESYGDNLYNTETLFKLPAENPPSVTLLYDQYAELQINIPARSLGFFEITLESSGHDNITLQSAWMGGSGWISGPNPALTDELLATDSPDTMRFRFTLDPVSPQIEKLRIRIRNTDAFHGKRPASIKIRHILLITTI